MIAYPVHLFYRSSMNISLLSYVSDLWNNYHYDNPRLKLELHSPKEPDNEQQPKRSTSYLSSVVTEAIQQDIEKTELSFTIVTKIDLQPSSGICTLSLVKLLSAWASKQFTSLLDIVTDEDHRYAGYNERRKGVANQRATLTPRS